MIRQQEGDVGRGLCIVLWNLTFFAVLLWLHLSDLVLGVQCFAIVVSMEEVDARDKLLRQLGLRLVPCSYRGGLPLT
jgi:hypothetical protein